MQEATKEHCAPSSYSGPGRESANGRQDKQCALSLRSCIDSAAIVMAMVRATHPHVSGEWVISCTHSCIPPLPCLVPGHNVDDENVRIVFRFSEF